MLRGKLRPCVRSARVAIIPKVVRAGLASFFNKYNFLVTTKDREEEEALATGFRITLNRIVRLFKLTRSLSDRWEAKPSAERACVQWKRAVWREKERYGQFIWRHFRRASKPSL